MTPSTSLRVAVISLVLAALAPSALAGPIIDAIRERREKRREAAESTSDTSSEMETAGSEGKAKVKLPAGARALMDQSFGSDPAQKLDVYMPANARGAPILMMVHGGAWMVGDKGATKVVANKVSRWLPKGYILVMPNYRMSRSAPKVMDQVDDVARALAWVQQHAPEWGGDPAKVLLMGHSAGAHLVSMLASDRRLASAHGTKTWLGTVALDSAAFDVVEMMEMKHYRFYDRVFGADRGYWQETSPLHRLTAAPLTPMLLVCSTRRPDACPQAKAYAAKASGFGGRASVLPVDLKHADVNGELGLGGDYTAQVEGFLRSVGLP